MLCCQNCFVIVFYVIDYIIKCFVLIAFWYYLILRNAFCMVLVFCSVLCVFGMLLNLMFYAI